MGNTILKNDIRLQDISNVVPWKVNDRSSGGIPAKTNRQRISIRSRVRGLVRAGKDCMSLDDMVFEHIGHFGQVAQRGGAVLGNGSSERRVRW